MMTPLEKTSRLLMRKTQSEGRVVHGTLAAPGAVRTCASVANLAARLLAFGTVQLRVMMHAHAWHACARAIYHRHTSDRPCNGSSHTLRMCAPVGALGSTQPLHDASHAQGGRS